MSRHLLAYWWSCLDSEEALNILFSLSGRNLLRHPQRLRGNRQRRIHGGGRGKERRIHDVQVLDLVGCGSRDRAPMWPDRRRSGRCRTGASWCRCPCVRQRQGDSRPASSSCVPPSISLLWATMLLGLQWTRTPPSAPSSTRLSGSGRSSDMIHQSTLRLAMACRIGRGTPGLAAVNMPAWSLPNICMLPMG